MRTAPGWTGRLQDPGVGPLTPSLWPAHPVQSDTATQDVPLEMRTLFRSDAFVDTVLIQRHASSRSLSSGGVPRPLNSLEASPAWPDTTG